MATPLRLLLLFFCASLLSACARNFVKPDLTTTPYAPAGSMENRLDFDISAEPVDFGEYFAQKLDKRDINLYAMRVRNYTRDTIWLGKEDIRFLVDSTALSLVPPKRVYRALRQPVAIHGLWLLLGPFVRDQGEEKVLDYHPLGLAAAAWGIRNGVVAYQSNREVREMISITMPAASVPLAPASTSYFLVPLPEIPAGASIDLLYEERVVKPAASPSGQQE